MAALLEKIRLTEFSHGGGCGCKIAPAVLSELLAATPIRGLPKDKLPLEVIGRMRGFAHARRIGRLYSGAARLNFL